jgi:high-affinity iron transporter
MGYGIYRGTLKINLSRFFLWSGVTLIVLAAGVLAYGIHDLQEAGVLPGAEVIAYDLGETIPVDTWYGTLLKGVFSFNPETSVLSFWVWWLYVLLAVWAFVRISRPTQQRK